MSREICFSIPLANGLHARPATQLMQLAEQFTSDIQLVNNRTNYVANGKSILSLIAGDFRRNDPCTLKISGNDENSASLAISDLFAKDLVEIESAHASQEPEKRLLPHFFDENHFAYLRGIPLVPGISEGIIEILPKTNMFDFSAITADSVHVERERVTSALNAVCGRLKNEVAHAKEPERGVLHAHYSIARDTEFKRQILSALEHPRTSAAGAISSAAAKFGAALQKTGSRLLQERVADIHDVCERLLSEIYKETKPATDFCLTGPTILCAHSITPQRLLSLDLNMLNGLVLTEAGATSHAIILARSFGIPTIYGVAPPDFPPQETPALMDGRLGVCVPVPPSNVREFFGREKSIWHRRKNSRASFAAMPAKSSDGTVLEVHANVISAVEIPSALSVGMDGVGLFRTEMIFLGRSSAPSESEQYQDYRRALLSAAGKPVTFRLLDIGGDKIPEYVKLNSESAELRGVQIYPHIQEMMRTQLRAILRSSSSGSARVLVPMVSCAAEVESIRKLIAEIRAELMTAEVVVAHKIPVGAMIETVQAAAEIKSIASAADFLSIGTNDLAQSLLNHSRENAGTLKLHKMPALMKVIQQIVADAHAVQKIVTICGEIAGDIHNLPILIGLGVDGISVTAQLIPEIKSVVTKMNFLKCREITATTIQHGDLTESSFLECQSTVTQALLSPDLLVLESASQSKTQALRELSNLLYASGLTNDPETVEQTLWKRETQHSTGFGHGFAIPHCKCAAVERSSVAIIKLKTPIAWNSIDNEPVSVVVMLAINEANAPAQHLAVFSSLARNLMKETFREELKSASNNDELLRLLNNVLSPKTAEAAG